MHSTELLFFYCIFFYVEQLWREFTPEWCGHGNRKHIHGGSITEEECKQRCSDCVAIEFWSGGDGMCYKCLDHTKRKTYTNTRDAVYPPHVFIRE